MSDSSIVDGFTNPGIYLIIYRLMQGYRTIHVTDIVCRIYARIIEQHGSSGGF